MNSGGMPLGDELNWELFLKLLNYFRDGLQGFFELGRVFAAGLGQIRAAAAAAADYSGRFFYYISGMVTPLD